MSVISAGVPAFASSGGATAANDLDYDSAWSASGTAWLAYDLSSVPSSRRDSVVLAWFTSPDDGHTVSSMQGVCPVWSGRGYLSAYSIEVNAAAGGGSAPTSGWVTAAAVSGNAQLSRQHRISFAGYNWIRIRGSGPNGINVNVDVADASAGAVDGWLFLGDSITAMYAGHGSLTGPTGRVARSFTDLIAAGTSGSARPVAQNSGTSCAKSYDAEVWIDQMLDSFPGRFVTLNFGTNDGWAGSGDPTAFHASMLSLVDAVLARGKVPVLATIPWPNNGGSWQAGIEALNAEIRKILTERPQVVPGPDLYFLLYGRTDLFRAAGDVHPNESGSALIRQAWADAALANVYRR